MGPPSVASGEMWPMAAPLRAAAEAAVGQQRHFLVQAHAGDGRGGGEHLPHAGAALGAFVADDHDVAGLNAALQDGAGGLFFGLKDPGAPFIDQHLGVNRRLFDHRAVRRQVAPENGNAPLGVIGVGQGTDDVWGPEPGPAPGYPPRWRRWR